VPEEKISRRSYAKYAAAGVVVIAGAAAGAYYATRPKVTPTPTPTPTPTVKPTPTPTPTPTKPKYDYVTTFPTPPGKTPKERAINGALMYLEVHPEARGHEFILTASPGSEGSYRPEYFKEFTDATGLKIKHLTISWDDFLPKYMAESVEKSGAYDVCVLIPQHWLGTFVEKGLVMDITAPPANYYQRYQPEWGLNEGPCPPYPALVGGVESYMGKIYGAVYDYDLWTLNYRADYFEDPKEKKNFYDKYGYELRPPRTWDEFRDVAEFFTRPPKMWGTWVYAVVFWNKNSYKQLLHSRGVDYFDENMVPLVDSPAGLEVIKFMKEMVDKYSPPEAKTGIWDMAYDFFIKGKIAMKLSWASLKMASMAAGLREEHKTALPIGYPTKDGRVRHAAHVGQTHVMFVNRYCKYPELSFAILTYWADPEVSTKTIADPGSFYEPFRTCHLDSEYVIERYGGRYYTDVLKEAFDWFTPDYNLDGATEYDDVLTKHVNAAMLGTEGLEEAMRAVHNEWEEITDRIGREKQIEANKAYGPPEHKGFGPKLAPLMDPNL
jgi:multiple sugar transport system substrate-binding protein